MAREPHETVRELSTAAVAARCLHVVAELGVADHIGDTAVPVAVLAAACDADADALDRVLRLVAAHGVFERRPEGYRHTPSSVLLREEHPRSMRAVARTMGLPLVWGSLAELERSVRTGRPGLEVLEPKGIRAYLQDRPVEADVVDRAMSAEAGAGIAAVLSGYDFTRFETIADIGGGRGHLLRAVLDATPGAAGILFDLPEVIDSLPGGHPRMAATAGDFFVDALPAADAYLLVDVLRDWADDRCVAVLGAVRRAAAAGAAVLVVECVLDETGPDRRRGTLDVVLLAVTGGRARTAAQLGELFERARLAPVRVVETAGPMRIVEARAG
ncbi:methyltransferase [Pseudonocardia saturnea]